MGIIVFVIVAGMVVVIKLLLEFPGLLQWKCVYSEHEHERENVGPPYLRRDLELGRAHSPRVKHSLDKSSSRVMETGWWRWGASPRCTGLLAIVSTTSTTSTMRATTMRGATTTTTTTTTRTGPITMKEAGELDRGQRARKRHC